MKKKLICTILALACGALTACASGAAAGFDPEKEIAVISREDGSGTRGAFVELFGIEQKNADGQKVDMTTIEAEITNSTSVMLTNISGNPYAIGYVSLGSMNDTVKALPIDGAAATVENIKNGSYTVARPFNIVTKGTLSAAAEEFMAFILSAEGQAVVENAGYISQGNNGAFDDWEEEGTVVITGSSSVTPVMEKLKEAFAAYNDDIDIVIQQSDSTTGINDALEGNCDLGMASRELKESEVEAGLVSQVIAMDGIAVIVNNDNPVEGLTKAQVADIFMGNLLTWDAL